MIPSANIVRTVQVLMDVLKVTRTFENKMAIQAQLELGVSDLSSQLSQKSRQHYEHLLRNNLGQRIDFRQEVIGAVVDYYLFNKIATKRQKELLAANGIYI